ncbi:MAG: hypothetical protein QM723_33030 [Myxococcaceae bacterium]
MLFRASLLALLITGCTGTVGDVPGGAGGGGGDPTGGGAGGGGTIPLRLSTFQSLNGGLPSNFKPAGAALLNGTIYLGGGSGVFSLDANATAWADSAAPLNAGETVTSVTRNGLTVLVTVADTAGGHGGVLAYDFGPGAWRRTMAPDAPAYALLKKSSELVLVAGDSLWASTDGNSWMKRSSGACVQGAVKFFAGSAAAVRIFTVTAAGLCFSDDQGASWNTGLIGGDIVALAAADQYVLIISTTDGAQRSENYGSTFHPFTPTGAVSAFAMTSGKTFAVTPAGLIVSDDGGQTWSDGNAGLPTGMPIDALVVAGSDVLASLGGEVWLAQLSLQ